MKNKTTTTETKYTCVRVFYGIKSIQLEHEFRNILANIYANDDEDDNNPDMEIMKTEKHKNSCEAVSPRIRARTKQSKREKQEKEKNTHKQTNEESSNV